ncbi:hypothetical protein N7495_005407 [Penicillium taxi]|uniref:uncharacterized protein n=1 Tax=Penicillium taxi TaxID=168475 RepID=UPI0025458AF9|nr:uncharacterized protein N7495_005407 [Penicillium taxi]KAJ5893716.1 hypothetical protein N7495_005407 [Penicillium taxi]
MQRKQMSQTLYAIGALVENEERSTKIGPGTHTHCPMQVELGDNRSCGMETSTIQVTGSADFTCGIPLFQSVTHSNQTAGAPSRHYGT